MRIIDTKSRKVIRVFANTFIAVYKKWLSAHAITNPQAWAEERLEIPMKVLKKVG